nr:hypothetical protein [Tanacetum cinerariifolium]
MNDLEEECQARALLAKSKRILKAPNSSLGKNKGLIVETYKWDEEEVSLDDNEVIKVKALMALADGERVSVGKESARNDNSNMSITSGNKSRLSEAKDFTLLNHDTGKVLPVESQRNITNPSIIVTDSSATDYDSADESSVVYSTLLPLLKKLAGANPIS